MRLLIIAALGSVLAAPALAEDSRRDSVTIGVGAVTVPRYEGASENVIIPAGAIRGTVGGVYFVTQGSALFVDLIPASGQPETKVILGPMAHLTLARASNSRTRDPQIIALGNLDNAIELGGHAGVRRTGVITSDYDAVTFDLAISHDVTGTHGSTIVTPSISYATPLSEKLYVGVAVGADHVGAGYARTYFGVTPAQAVASLLPAYAPGSGFKDVNFSLLGNAALTGDLRHGLSLFAVGNYEKLLGDFGRSPVVRDRNQWYGGLGLAYTF